MRVSVGSPSCKLGLNSSGSSSGVLPVSAPFQYSQTSAMVAPTGMPDTAKVPLLTLVPSVPRPNRKMPRPAASVHWPNVRTCKGASALPACTCRKATGTNSKAKLRPITATRRHADKKTGKDETKVLGRHRWLKGQVLSDFIFTVAFERRRNQTIRCELTGLWRFFFLT